MYRVAQVRSKCEEYSCCVFHPKKAANCAHKNPKKIFRLQSAMEYLMTYGWAILIIAVVLGALYYLGIFGSATAGLRAQPGSCQVTRPNGPTTTQFISLAGFCNNLLPLSIASLSNNYHGYVSIPNGNVIFASNTFTVSAWTRFTGAVGTDYGTILATSTSPYMPYITMDYSLTTIKAELALGSSYYRRWSNSPVNALNGEWHHIAFTVPAGDITNSIFYVDGKTETVYSTTTSGAANVIAGNAYIGRYSSTYGKINIANLQIYNASLDANEIQGMYAEGIGGAPTRLQNLVGWWTMNGDTNDYSGNNYDGVSANVVFTSTWSD